MGGGQSGAVSWPSYMQSTHHNMLNLGSTAGPNVPMVSRVNAATGQSPFNVVAVNPEPVIGEMDSTLLLWLQNINEADAYTLQTAVAQSRGQVEATPAIDQDSKAFVNAHPTEYITLSQTLIPPIVVDGTFLTALETINPEYVNLTYTPTVTVPAITELIDLTLLVLDESKIAADVAAHNAQLTDILNNETIPRIQMGLLDINAINSSAFPIAIAIASAMKNRDVAKHSSELRVQTVLQNERLNAGLMQMRMDWQGKLRSLRAELLMQGEVKTEEILLQVFQLEEDINARLKLFSHEARTRLRSLGAELSTRVTLDNQENRRLLVRLQEELNAQLKLQNHQAFAAREHDEAEYNIRWLTQGRDLVYQYQKLRQDLVQRYVLGTFERMQQIAQLHHQFSMAVLERSRVKLVARVEQQDRQVNLNEHHRKWDLDVFEYMNSTLGAVSGGGGGHVSGKRPSAAVSALGGAIGGAGAGAATGAAIGSGGGPWGAAIGAVVGAGLALASR